MPGNGSLKIIMLAATVLAGMETASAQNFGNAYYLGDSLTDCCFRGRKTNGNQPGYSDVLPGLIGATYTASQRTDTAVGGAQSGVGNITPSVDVAFGPTGLLSQLNRYAAAGVQFTSRDTAGIWIGTNDILASSYRRSFPGIVNQPLGPLPATAALTDYTVGNVRTAIDSLTARGLRNLVLVSVYDLGPAAAIVPGASLASTTAATAYSQALRDAYRSLYTPGVNTYFLDTYTLLQKVQANPGIYGFTSTTSNRSCLVGCAGLSTREQNSFVFNDPIHFTSGFQTLMAKYIANTINARESLSSQGDLAQAVGIGFSGILLNRLDAYRDQNTPAVVPGTYAADLPGRPVSPSAIPILLGSPVSLFVEGAYSRIDRNARITPNGPSNPGFGADFAGVTAGIEYRVTPNLLVGAAFNYFNTSVNLRGLSNASIDLNSYQGAVFASYNQRNAFMDGALTYGTNAYTLSRPGVIDTLTAAPSGNTFTAAGKIGYLFDFASFRVGPIAELTYANVGVGSYSERGDNLLSLGLRRQSFDGLTGGAGIQLRTTLPFFGGLGSVFLNGTVQHDFLNGVRTITSFGTNAPALLINTQAGQRGNDVYGKVAAGIAMDLGHGLSGVLSGSATVGRDSGNDYAATAGLRYRF